MKKTLRLTLQKILRDTEREMQQDIAAHSLERLKQMVKAAPPVRSFASAIASGNALIAEIKERSPSQGTMRRQNFEDAPLAYKRSEAVKAVSVLTNRTHFGMNVEWLARMKDTTGKPVLRKDFIFDAYQVYQARAFGAD